MGDMEPNDSFRFLITIGGSKGGRQGRAPPPVGPNSFIFMQFSRIKLKNNSTFGSWRTPLGKILDPPLITTRQVTGRSCFYTCLSVILVIGRCTPPDAPVLWSHPPVTHPLDIPRTHPLDTPLPSQTPSPDTHLHLHTPPLLRSTRARYASYYNAFSLIY